MDSIEYERLREKFLGPKNKDLKTAIASDLPGWKLTEDGTEEVYDSNTQTRTVKVEPQSGGPAKIADYKNGRIEIVQG